MKTNLFLVALLLSLSFVTAFSVGYGFLFGGYLFQPYSENVNLASNYDSVSLGSKINATLATVGSDWNGVLIEVKNVNETSCDWTIDYDGNITQVVGDGNYAYFNVSGGKTVKAVATVKVSEGNHSKGECWLDGNVHIG